MVSSEGKCNMFGLFSQFRALVAVGLTVAFLTGIGGMFDAADAADASSDSTISQTRECSDWERTAVKKLRTKACVVVKSDGTAKAVLWVKNNNRKSFDGSWSVYGESVSDDAERTGESGYIWPLRRGEQNRVAKLGLTDAEASQFTFAFQVVKEKNFRTTHVAALEVAAAAPAA